MRTVNRLNCLPSLCQVQPAVTGLFYSCVLVASFSWSSDTSWVVGRGSPTNTGGIYHFTCSRFAEDGGSLAPCEEAAWASESLKNVYLLLPVRVMCMGWHQQLREGHCGDKDEGKTELRCCGLGRFKFVMLARCFFWLAILKMWSLTWLARVRKPQQVSYHYHHHHTMCSQYSKQTGDSHAGMILCAVVGRGFCWLYCIACLQGRIDWRDSWHDAPVGFGLPFIGSKHARWLHTALQSFHNCTIIYNSSQFVLRVQSITWKSEHFPYCLSVEEWNLWFDLCSVSCRLVRLHCGCVSVHVCVCVCVCLFVCVCVCGQMMWKTKAATGGSWKHCHALFVLFFICTSNKSSDNKCLDCLNYPAHTFCFPVQSNIFEHGLDCVSFAFCLRLCGLSALSSFLYFTVRKLGAGLVGGGGWDDEGFVVSVISRSVTAENWRTSTTVCLAVRCVVTHQALYCCLLSFVES